jgi:hypothetical protein
MVILARVLITLAALDSLAVGIWAKAFPDQLFTFLQVKIPTDGFLWPVLGWLSLANAVCLAAVAVWPGEYGGLTLVPWVGRLLSCGLWLWLLGTSVIHPAHEPLWYLLAHDAFFLLALTVFLVIHYVPRRRSA